MESSSFFTVLLPKMKIELSGIDLQSLSDDWFCDGTFSTAPIVFYQFYTILLKDALFLLLTLCYLTKRNQIIVAFSVF